jgi:GNAT superfamily N-acetyltransferase
VELIRIRVRRARDPDAGACAAVWLAARHAAVPAIPPPAHTDDEVRSWFAGTVLPERDVRVAEHRGQVIGVLVLEPGVVDQLYVEPGWQRRGVGTALLLAAKELHDSLELWTFESNVEAHAFYERHGFEVVERTDGSSNEERAPDRRYRWTSAPVGRSAPTAVRLGP